MPKKGNSGAQQKARLAKKRQAARNGTKKSFKDDWDWGPAAASGTEDAVLAANPPEKQQPAEGGSNAVASPGISELANADGSLGLSNVGAWKMRTVLVQDSKETIAERKRDATRPLCYKHGAARLASPVGNGGIGQDVPIEMPMRLPWDPSWSAEELEGQENASFEIYLNGLYAAHGREKLNTFEHNLEVWRQLWRTVEKSDIVVILADARSPLLHFNESLFRHIVEDHGKIAVLVLNKADLVPPIVVRAWERYFTATYPPLKVIALSACPAGVPPRHGVTGAAVGLQLKEGGRHPRAHTFGDLPEPEPEPEPEPHDASDEVEEEEEEDSAYSAAHVGEGDRGRRQDSGPQQLWDLLGTLLLRPKPLDLKSRTAAQRQVQAQDGDSELERGGDEREGGEDGTEEQEAAAAYLAGHGGLSKRGEQKCVTVGVVGEPNLGKSSLINAIFGSKVVSRSSTPGHTKHLQSLYFNRSTALVDSPGVVFPRAGVPPGLQVLSPLFSTSQETLLLFLENVCKGRVLPYKSQPGVICKHSRFNGCVPGVAIGALGLHPDSAIARALLRDTLLG